MSFSRENLSYYILDTTSIHTKTGFVLNSYSQKSLLLTSGGLCREAALNLQAQGQNSSEIPASFWEQLGTLLVSYILPDANFHSRITQNNAEGIRVSFSLNPHSSHKYESAANPPKSKSGFFSDGRVQGKPKLGN